MAAAEKRELLQLLEEKLRRRARDDLNAYCRYIEIPGVPINEDDPDCEQFYPDNVTPAAHHELLNHALMKVEAGEIRRLMVFMPPGSAKSTYGSVSFPTWFMGRKRGRNVICASYGSDLAKRFGRKCRQITRSKRYLGVFDTELVADNRAADDWSLTNESTYKAGGILSGITGNRADGLVIDDPVKGRADADSTVIREKAWEEYKSSLRTRLKPNGFILIISTRWHEDDLSGRILPQNWDGESGWVTAKDGEQWYVICLQAQCETDSDPLGRKRGEWLWTEWFSPEHWAQEKITQGSRNWDALYQQKPKPSEGGIFKRAWVPRYRVPPVEGIIVQSIDTGNKPKEINDPSVCTTWLVTPLHWYLLHVWRDRVAFPDLLHSIKGLAATWKPTGIVIEDKASGTQLIQTLRAETRLPVIPFDPSPHGDKIMRAQNVSPLVEAGRVLLPEQADWLIDFESEFFGFPISATKDQVDSVSQFLKWAHKDSMVMEAWGSGQQRAGIGAFGSQGSQIDIERGFGTVRSDTDLSGY
jgi:predicted phage terminase large subunit-like protein